MAINSNRNEMPAKSIFDMALRNVAKWSGEDQKFFIAVFTSNKTESDLASHMGMSKDSYQDRRRNLLRRFIYPVAAKHAVQTQALPV